MMLKLRLDPTKIEAIRIAMEPVVGIPQLE